MVELSSVSSLTPIAPSQDASEPKQNSATLYGVVQPSFSYLNVNNPPSRSSQQSSASPMKDSLKSDARYKAVKHEDRERSFNEYISEQKAAEKLIEGKEKTKHDEEEKLKERERALCK
ncbi:pre-mRNA-processing protein 40C-like isoform X2 [Olea europaea var. sylvestris]|uniref:pre-mRNA-processing protein 40C-like isoform X2 n=1 Tax=Olea europaea var. sylvestris TaxID=158386 RepID=UPI000C1CF8C1|nr:pre-mRNA-processing protein 40C-like isoform X2 [Olea europaea var. sylvestris]